MTMTLAQAITRVRFLLDDSDANPLISDAEITTALEVGQEEVWQLVIDSGANVFYQTADIASPGNGVVDVSSIKPLKIINVAQVVGTYALQIPPCRPFDGFAPVLSAVNVRLVYVPRATFPALSSDPFVWSQAAISMTTLDQLLCHTAAAQCWVRTGEPPLASMEKRRAELAASVTSSINIPSWSVSPLDDTGSTDSGFYWRRTSHDTLQLVYG
jgi:hypothetical protein